MAKKKKKVKAVVAKDCLHCNCCIPISEVVFAYETTRDRTLKEVERRLLKDIVEDSDDSLRCKYPVLTSQYVYKIIREVRDSHSSFDPNDMTKMFMRVEKLEPIPIDSIFNFLAEKEQAEARRKGTRVARFWNFVHASKRFFKVGDNK